MCAAAAGAALSHLAIDVVGDFALARDSYDHLRHDSRDLVSGIALIVAVLLAGRGLRACCEIAAANRHRLARPLLGARDLLATLAAAIAGSVALVPAMELLDGRLDGVAVSNVADSFGGSIALGLATTLVCAALLALVILALARWLIAHRDSIVTIIATLLAPVDQAARPCAYEGSRRHSSIRRRRAPTALRLAKRGPPAICFA